MRRRPEHDAPARPAVDSDLADPIGIEVVAAIERFENPLAFPADTPEPVFQNGLLCDDVMRDVKLAREYE